MYQYIFRPIRIVIVSTNYKYKHYNITLFKIIVTSETLLINIKLNKNIFYLLKYFSLVYFKHTCSLIVF